jgi:phosphonate transport system substrate-binding protein
MLRLLVVLITVLFLACGAMADTVKIGVFPSNDPAKLQAVMDVLAEYLAENTGDTVEVLVTRDYEELVTRLFDHTVDLAWINTLNYVLVKNALPGVRYMTTYMERNQTTGNILPYYQSYIVTLKDSGIANLKDAKGKRFAFTDMGSTSGYAYPNLLLRKRGIDAHTYFQKVFFLKKHDRVVQALLAGSIDLGAMSDGAYFAAKRTHGERFAILAKSEPIPLDAIVAAEGFPQHKAAAYRKALESMPPDHAFCKAMREVLGWSAAGFETRGDAFYDSVREALK